MDRSLFPLHDLRLRFALSTFHPETNLFIQQMTCRALQAEPLPGYERIYSSCSVQTRPLYFLDPEEFEGKSAKSVKQCLAAKFGVTRFKQKLLEEGSDGWRSQKMSHAFVKVQLVILDFWPPDKQQDQPTNGLCIKREQFGCN